MAVYFKCKEVGLDCPFEAKSKTKEELMKKVEEHAEKEHGIKDLPPNLKAKFEDAIKKYPAY